MLNTAAQEAVNSDPVGQKGSRSRFSAGHERATGHKSQVLAPADPAPAATANSEANTTKVAPAVSETVQAAAPQIHLVADKESWVEIG